MSNKIKTYHFHLPVFKQGDDLASFLNKDGTNGHTAFSDLAGMYEYAATLCRQMSNVASELPEMVVEADTHMILVTGPEDALSVLAEGENALLSRDEDEEYEYDIQ